MSAKAKRKIAPIAWGGALPCGFAKTLARALIWMTKRL
ncbi:MAG: hypothetical protein ACJASV_000471 [Pseudorhodobacter sp.]|jgi:hypothetical protein